MLVVHLASVVGCDGNNTEDQNRSTSPMQIAKIIGYDAGELELIPESSILGVGCGAPVKFANIKEGEAVVDIRFWGGIDVFSVCK